MAVLETNNARPTSHGQQAPMSPAGTEKTAPVRRYANSLANSRLELIQNILAQDPQNLLARYGLAMEYVNQNEWGKAIPEFETVLGLNPEYSAAYFHGGQTLEKMGRIDDARDWYRRGIAATRDPHARGELEAALSILGD